MRETDEDIDENRLLIALVDLVASGSALSIQFERLAQDLGVPRGAQMIIFLTGVKGILRDLPEKAFIDRNSRLSMIDAVQDALDAAIDEEENAGGDDVPAEPRP